MSQSEVLISLGLLSINKKAEGLMAQLVALIHPSAGVKSTCIRSDILAKFQNLTDGLSGQGNEQIYSKLYFCNKV